MRGTGVKDKKVMEAFSAISACESHDS
jgi:hypothetical protein